MPTIPLISAPETGGAAQPNPARLSPVLANPTKAPAIRANPGMFDAENAAVSRVGGAVEGLANLAFHVKNATDASYITRTQTDLQATNTGFETWTKTNPDPSTWDAELNDRISAAKAKADEGAKDLSPMAKLRLKTTLTGWETTTRARVQLQATEQNLNIAQASFKDFIEQAAVNNDLPAIEAKVKEGVAAGIFHPAAGQSILKRARVQVATNVANAMIEADPFDAEKRINAKNDAGEYENLSGLSDTARQTLYFRAHKMASEVRSNTQREWATAIGEWQAGRAPMPDKEAMEQEAAHQGISPKWLERQFKTPEPLNPQDFADAYIAISNYDQSADPSAKRLGELVAQVTGFKDGAARARLDALLTEKTKPAKPGADPLKSDVAKFGEASLKDMFTIGGYGHYKETIRNPQYPSNGPEFKTVINPAQKQAAELVWARNLTLFHDWLKEHPKATPEEAQKFINSLNAQKAANNASRLIINSGAFGLGR